MVEPYRVTIYDRQLDALFRPGGEAWHWLGLLGTEHLQWAINMTPTRTGHLRSSFYPVPIMTPHAIGGGRGSRYTIRNDAEYAEAVHEGTDPNRRWGPGGIPVSPGQYVPWDDGTDRPAYLGPMAPWGYRSVPFALSVRGQKANPWILEAATIALGPWIGR